MSESLLYEELDLAIEEMLASDDRQTTAHPKISGLLEVAKKLHDLPRSEFRDQLRLELDWKSAGRLIHAPSPQSGPMPSLFAFQPVSGWPVRRGNFIASLALHAAMLALVALGLMTVSSAPHFRKVASPSVMGIDLVAPASLKTPPGGGGGGDLDKQKASRGALPKFSEQQFTPPVAIVRNDHPIIVMQPTLVGPPELNLPKTENIGDPLSALATPSNGRGVRSGVGTGDGQGDGPGSGPGSGPGPDFGRGSSLYSLGSGVMAPRPIYSPEPEYSDEARKIKRQGIVTLWAVIGTDGRPRDIHVMRSLGMGLDEKAIAAVHTWRFQPGTLDGRPVPVQISIEVNFNLF